MLLQHITNKYPREDKLSCETIIQTQRILLRRVFE